MATVAELKREINHARAEIVELRDAHTAIRLEISAVKHLCERLERLMPEPGKHKNGSKWWLPVVLSASLVLVSAVVGWFVKELWLHTQSEGHPQAVQSLKYIQGDLSDVKNRVEKNATTINEIRMEQVAGKKDIGNIDKELREIKRILIGRETPPRRDE